MDTVDDYSVRMDRLKNAMRNAGVTDPKIVPHIGTGKLRLNISLDFDGVELLARILKDHAKNGFSHRAKTSGDFDHD